MDVSITIIIKLVLCLYTRWLKVPTTCFNAEPEMWLLHQFVIPKIAADWSLVADYLEYQVECKKVIRRKCRDDPMECCVELLEDWLSSDNGVSPKSWSKLIEILKKIKSLAAATENIVQDLAKAGVVL